jgi:RNA polymerase sigma factor (sigma-70 family)
MSIKKTVQEKDLVQGCLKQDRKYQKLLFEKYFSDMMSVCMRYARDDDDAKDILQNSFIKVFAKFELFSGEGSLRGWIQSIVVRTAIDHYRRQQRENRNVVSEPEDWEAGEEADIEADLAAEEIMKIVQMLPNMQRTVFNLFALEGFSHKEIATQLEITEGTSKWYLCEARKSLKLILSPVYSFKLKEYAA